MGFTFDAPISASYTAYDKANKDKPSGIPLPSKPKPKRKSLTSPSSLLSSIRPSFVRRSNPLTSPPVFSPISPSGVRASESSFFRLPWEIRQKIYGYVLGHDEVVQVLLRRKAPTNSYFAGHRRCRAGGNRDDCGIACCREFLDIGNGVYFGRFDDVISLLLACRDISKEATKVLYTQNTFDFDHPLALLLFCQQISRAALHVIRSISLDLGKYLYDAQFKIHCRSFAPSQWAQAWDVISKMEGLEEIRARFRSPVDGWMGWTEGKVLEPLWKVKTPLKVFEVEACSTPKGAFDDGELESEAPFTLVKDVQFPRS